VRSLLALLLAAATAAPPPPPRRPAVFRADIELVFVNVVVRDGKGAPVRGLTKDDFVVTEDGKGQTVETFDVEEVPTQALPADAVPQGDATPLPLLKPRATPPTPAELDEALTGHRLVVLLFDSLPPEQLARALDSARNYIDKRMAAADLVAVAAVDSGLKVHQDFTADREKLQAALDTLQGIDDTGAATDTTATATDEADAAAAAEAVSTAAEASELEMFDIDQRLRALETLSTALSPLRQKKSVIYFSGGMGGTGVDNQVEMRAAIDRAVRANVAIYPVDSRGLEAVVPGGDASRASSTNTETFSGRSMQREFDRRIASQDTLTSLAADTGGKTFFDTNEFSGVFDRVLNDTSTYYVLGYASTNTNKDGHFRRIKVQLKKPGLRLEHRSGYYADKDFEHSNRGDRERRLREQLLTDLSATDLPVWLRTAYFRAEEDDRYHVAVSVGVPGNVVNFTREGDEDRASFELMGGVRDEADRYVARLRDSIKVAVKAPAAPVAPASTPTTAPPAEDVRKKNVQYQTVLTVPPGHYKLKVVVQENKLGTMGSFETDIRVPDLRKAAVKLSSVVLGTQIQPAKGRSALNPLARDGSELVQSLTHVVSAGRPLYLYYEVYDPTKAKDTGDVKLLTSLSFFRGKVRRYETPLVEVTKLAAPERKAAVFQFSVPAASLQPGFYVCQVNVIDDVAGTFAFPRVPLLVR
jgi:VWFA-related protein